MIPSGVSCLKTCLFLKQSYISNDSNLNGSSTWVPILAITATADNFSLITSWAAYWFLVLSLVSLKCSVTSTWNCTAVGDAVVHSVPPSSSLIRQTLTSRGVHEVSPVLDIRADVEDGFRTDGHQKWYYYRSGSAATVGQDPTYGMWYVERSPNVSNLALFRGLSNTVFAINKFSGRNLEHWQSVILVRS